MPRVFDLIKPLDNRDTYAITDVVFQKGGLREVANLEAMNAISLERRTTGMIAFTIDTGQFYSLTGGDLTNDSWEKIDFAPNIIGNITPREFTIEPSENSISDEDDENVAVNVLNTSIVRIKSGSSISTITDANTKDGKLLFLQNLTNSNIIIKNDYLKTLNSFNNLIDNQAGLKQIAFNGDNNVYIMVSTEGVLLKSNDLETWTIVPDIDENVWESITQSGSIFIAVASDGTNRVVFSSDGGNTWVHVAVELYEWKSITHRGGLFIAVAENKAMYSVDGLEWTYVDLPEGKLWQQIVYGKETFVVIAYDENGTDDIIVSVDDGLTWATSTVEKFNDNINIKVRFVNDKFYLITNLDVQVSTDGLTWLPLGMPYNSDGIKDIIYNNDYYFFIRTNDVYYTDDLSEWQIFEFISEHEFVDFTIKNDKYYLLYHNGIDELNIANASDNNYSIYTGTNLELIFLKNSSILLQFSEVEDVWRVIGGVSLNPTLLSLLDVADEYPVVPVNNNVFLLVNPDEESDDRVVFENPFPVIENDDNELVIDHINGLRIRRFNSTTGELMFAKFTPTIVLNVPALLINFDDPITTITNIIVTNDTFVPTVKVTTVTNIFYHVNEDVEETVDLITTPILPHQNLNHTWSQGFTFDPISDENTSFGLTPNSFTIRASLVDTENNVYEVNKTITYRIPTFSFSIGNESRDFRDLLDSCDLTFTYANVTNKNNSSTIASIEALLPDGLGGTSNVSFSNLIDGMDEYVAEDLGITADNITKGNSLTDNGTFAFTTVCRYLRPISIDPNGSFYEIELTANLNVSFTYPIFTGTTAITTTSLTASNVVNNLTNSGNTEFPRSFTSVVGGSNLHFWFCVRKRYINNRTPIILLSSNGFGAHTVILGSNEVEITTYSSSETYVCYYILLQANNTYSINISI